MQSSSFLLLWYIRESNYKILRSSNYIQLESIQFNLLCFCCPVFLNARQTNRNGLGIWTVEQSTASSLFDLISHLILNIVIYYFHLNKKKGNQIISNINIIWSGPFDVTHGNVFLFICKLNGIWLDWKLSLFLFKWKSTCFGINKILWHIIQYIR